MPLVVMCALAERSGREGGAKIRVAQFAFVKIRLGVSSFGAFGE